VLRPWRRNRERRTKTARPVECDCAAELVRRSPDFVAEATRVLREFGMNGPYETYWHADGCPNNGDGND
jgi:hypothetical protein